MLVTEHQQNRCTGNFTILCLLMHVDCYVLVTQRLCLYGTL